MATDDFWPPVTIEGASRLIEVYGHWISFHTGTVERITIEANRSINLEDTGPSSFSTTFPLLFKLELPTEGNRLLSNTKTCGHQPSTRVLKTRSPSSSSSSKLSCSKRNTNGLVEGVVKESTIEGTVWYALYLWAPLLGVYMTRVRHIAIPLNRPPSDPFSFAVQNVSDWASESEFVRQDKHLSDLGEFKTWLRDVLSSGPVVSVIENLISRSHKAAVN